MFISYLYLTVADDMGTSGVMEGLHAAGYNSILPKEHGNKMFNLPIVKYCEKDVSQLINLVSQTIAI